MKLSRRGREPKQKPVLAAILSTAGCSMSSSETSTPAPSNPRVSDKKTQKESNTKDFQCDRCPRKFTRRENLARHANSRGSTLYYASLNLKLPLNTCDVLTNLRLSDDHSKYHQCSICGKGFSRSDMLSRHEAGHERWDQQKPSASRSRGPRKRRKVAFEEDATSSTDTVDPTLAVEGREVTDVQGWNQEGSPGLIAFPDMSASSALQLNQSNDQRNIMAHQNSHSLPDMSDARLPLYGDRNYLRLPNSFHAQEYLFQNLPNAHGEVPSPLASFDFSAFLLPATDNESSGFSYDWFSNDFYSAMKETGNEDVEFNDMLSLTFQSPMQFDQYPATPGPTQSWESHPDFHREEAPGKHNQFDVTQQLENLSQPEPGRISRISSPPNEPSEEDKWPFTWNPRSRPILRANPVKIPNGHPLWRNHNPRFDITASTFRRVQAFINPVMSQGFARPLLELPSLPEINIFINLFFERFSPQAPVLHHATVDMNDDLPPPLLAAMVVIGAIHSRLLGTRRFSIVLLDVVRWNLQTAIECDNTLMREPMIIFAEALVCHAGLWCGNKRAFELAEVVRSMAVKHVRSAQFWRGNAKPDDHEKSEFSTRSEFKTQWKNWIAKEAQKRLFWVIYALDAQFAGLMYLPATFAIGEVRNLYCPCDDEFWSAQTARVWKSLLGDATAPPSRTFSAALEPFSQAFAPVRTEARTSRPQSSQSPIPNLNAWSAFLVLTTLQVQIFNFSQERLFVGAMIDQDDVFEDTQSPEYDIDATVSNSLRTWQTIRREILLGMPQNKLF
jgi:hypothetical protein